MIRSPKHMMNYIISWGQENKRNIFKLEKRWKKSKDFDDVKCVKTDDQNILMKDVEA